MAPILSLPKESLDRIRKAVALAVVSIWQVDDSSGSKVSFRSGFVFDCENNACIVLTLKKDLDRSRKLFVQFENGKCFEGLTTFGDEKSNLVAIEVIGLGFEPKKVILSEHNADQCDEVVHMGIFDEENLKLNFSSGSVCLAGHRVHLRKEDEDFTEFCHCCSQKLHLIGGPVFNLRNEMVGVNYSQRENLFFALDLEQLLGELERLFGKNMERVPELIKEAKILRAKRRKTR